MRKEGDKSRRTPWIDSFFHLAQLVGVTTCPTVEAEHQVPNKLALQAASASAAYIRSTNGCAAMVMGLVPLVLRV
jgi:hypothetical protein